jgi:hypothetical protein
VHTKEIDLESSLSQLASRERDLQETEQLLLQREREASVKEQRAEEVLAEARALMKVSVVSHIESETYECPLLSLQQDSIDYQHAFEAEKLALEARQLMLVAKEGEVEKRERAMQQLEEQKLRLAATKDEFEAQHRRLLAKEEELEKREREVQQLEEQKLREAATKDAMLEAKRQGLCLLEEELNARSRALDVRDREHDGFHSSLQLLEAKQQELARQEVDVETRLKELRHKEIELSSKMVQLKPQPPPGCRVVSRVHRARPLKQRMQRGTYPEGEAKDLSVDHHMRVVHAALSQLVTNKAVGEHSRDISPRRGERASSMGSPSIVSESKTRTRSYSVHSIARSFM